MVYRSFDKKTSGETIKNKNISNKELAEELQKPIIRKVNKRKVHSLFTENIQDTDLADMQLISKFNTGFRFLLCVIDIYSKCAWVILNRGLRFLLCVTNIYSKYALVIIPLKDKNELQLLMIFKKS